VPEAVFFNGFDVRLPHVHDDGLNGFSLLARQLLEESIQRLGLSVSANVNNMAGFVVEHHGQIAVALVDGDLIHRQDVNPV
jgi:hypothetical protein